MQDVKVNNSGGIILLGKQGENRARRVLFDISRWISTFGPGTVQLLHQRSGDEAPYPVAVEQDGTLAIWKVSSADTARPGGGHCELRYYVDETLAKSETWMTKVLPALGDASETPPEAQQGWVDQVLAEVARITGMTAQAVELPAGAAPTADYADGVLTIGIPLGGDVSETQIAQAVAEYLEKHPIAETDPTVPDWAKAPTKPGYTASEVGADSSGTAASLVMAHNTGTDTHSDMRLLIQDLTSRLNALADSDDTTLDQLSEIVAYIKSNRDLIAAITTDKVGVGDIVNDLVTNVANNPLSAAQGVALKALIDAINAVSIGAIPAPATATVGQTIRVSAVDENGKPTEWEAVDMGSAGGGIGTGTYDFSVLASGTIPANTITAAEFGNGVVDTGITLGMLRKYKIFNMLYRCDDGNQYYSFLVGAPGYALHQCKRFLYSTSNARNATVFWIDQDRTAILMLCGVGNSNVTSPSNAENMGGFLTSGLSSVNDSMASINAYGNLTDFPDESKIYVGVAHMNGKETNTKGFTWAICGVVK